MLVRPPASLSDPPREPPKDPPLGSPVVSRNTKYTKITPTIQTTTKIESVPYKLIISVRIGNILRQPNEMMPFEKLTIIMPIVRI